MENIFKVGKKRKCVLWNLVVRKIKQIDKNFPFTTTGIMRKFNNCMLTYRRIKSKQSQSGSEKVYWEYYDEFDSVYGNKHSNNAPNNMLISTLSTTNYSGQGSVPNSTFFEMENADNGGDQSSPAKRKNLNREIFNYLKEQNNQEQKKEEERFQKLLEVEERRTQAERDKVTVLG